jgi:hypothetical protein
MGGKYAKLFEEEYILLVAFLAKISIEIAKINRISGVLRNTFVKLALHLIAEIVPNNMFLYCL